MLVVQKPFQAGKARAPVIPRLADKVRHVLGIVLPLEIICADPRGCFSGMRVVSPVAITLGEK